MSLGVLLRKLRDNYRDGDWWRRNLSLRNGIVPAYFLARDDPENGVDIVAEDWDNLLILDACRYDMFSRLNTLPGDLERRRSRSSSTGTFLNRNFSNGPYHDIVYVTATPMLNIMLDTENLFHDVINVWESAWNEEFRTVMPETMAEATREAYEQYPNKRIIAHFVQPHYPFIGETARENLPEQRGFERGRKEVLTGDGEVQAKAIWKQLEEGAIDRESVQEMYDENLETVLEAIEPLVEHFDERTIVTSDHGNMLGEFAWPFPIRIYGHPEIRTDELVTVPWLVIGGTTRKELITDSPVEQGDTVESTVARERLADLGYVDS
ncbi:hypothetical protein [Halorussus amylolyticus]|uniref:hypothetical protein n=1 Tax=Halorussus amylolyticus TaxID=1126242 RepID=UPI0010486822|nr:hypothetical protein [Halorussus amylolyticus]